MHGPTCIFGANLTPFSLADPEMDDEIDLSVDLDGSDRMSLAGLRRPGVKDVFDP